VTESSERIFAVNGEPADADKARQWGEFWRVKYAQRYQNDAGRWLYPIRRTARSEVISLGRTHCRDVILELERAINGGKQLSEPRPT
jgi:hypothetical protein